MTRVAPPEGAPPHGVDLPTHARLAATLAEGAASEAEVLAAHGLSERAWQEATAHWMQAMLDDAVARGAEARLVHEYSAAFAEAQDALAPVAPMTPEGWADLCAEILAEGDPARPLSRRRLSAADHQRLVRHFARTLPADPEAARRYGARFAERTSASGG